MDSAENIFIADTYNNRIRKVDGNGIITTVAGDAGSGFNGDGHPATNTTLNQPEGVAIDGDDNLVIADTYNGRIREDAFGIIFTVAGGGGSNSGDGGEAIKREFGSCRRRRCRMRTAICSLLIRAISVFKR